MKPRHIRILSIDALSYWMLERYLEEWELKNFQRLKREGAFAEGMIAPGPDATTPPAHAALFCGCVSQEHGIYSFEEPVIENGIIHPWKKKLGFDATRLKAEPLWVSFLKSGRKVLLLHFPLSMPLEPYTSSACFGQDFSENMVVIESFSQRLAPEFCRKHEQGNKTFTITLPDNSRIVLPASAPEKPEVQLFPSKLAGILKMRFSPDTPDEPDFYFGTSIHKIFCNHEELAQNYFDTVGPFIGGGAVYSYWKNRLGNMISRDGSGKAELRVFETLEKVAEHFLRAIQFGIQKVQPEVGFYYFHIIDLALHLWRGLIDPDCPGSSPEIRGFLLPLIRKTFVYADQALGLLMDATDKNDLLAVVSDHGMSPIEKTFYPNQLFLEAGLLKWDSKKKEPVLDQTYALYHQSNSGYIVINTEARGGIVKEESKEIIIKKVYEVLSPFLGTALEKIEMVSEHPEIPALGEIYLTPRYKVSLMSKVEGEIMEPGHYGGQHHFWQESEPMQAVLMLKGPGVPAGVGLGLRSHLEFAPTIAYLAEIPKPEKARCARIRF